MENDNQHIYGDRKTSTWRCPECETVNTGDQCYVCLQPRPVVEEMKMCTCGYRNNKNAKYCAKCGRRLGGINWKLIICAVLVIIVLALTVKNILPKLSDEGTKYTESPTISTVSTVSIQETVAEDAWKDNVLMKDRAMEVIPLGSFKSSVVMNTVLGSDIIRSDICRVVFEDTLQNVPDDCWDASDAQDNSVLAWAIPAEDNLYELHIAAEGGINGKLACEDLFCGYQNLTSIDFNNSFHTEESEDFSRMFYYCWQLEKLNLDGIRTDNATNLSEMFANCFHLTSINVSGFNTSKVEDTSGMFSNCRELQTVDIMNFDLVPVRDVSYMFYQCPAGDGLQMVLDWFWFKNVDRYENFMDEGVLVNGEPWITLFEVEDTLEEPNSSAVKSGDIIVFGSYEQDNLEENGPEAVEWLVLDVQDNYALLLSRYALDSQRYHKVTAQVSWNNCSLREWLNNDFMNAAFTKSQQEVILKTGWDNDTSVDRIFILGCTEVDRYVTDWNALICAPTSYALSRGAGKNQPDGSRDAVSWWLRSLDESGNQAYCVSFKGEQYTYMVGNDFMSVRPAMCIDLSKAVWE